MADVKWIKITTDIFDDEKILLIESLPDGDALIVIWFKLLCLAGRQNNKGVFMLNDRIPFTEEMLATIFRRPIQTVRLALDTFESFGMIETIDGVITIPNWEKHQNIEGLEKIREQTRKRVVKFRANQKLVECNATSNATVTQGNATDKNREDKNRKEKSSKFTPPTLEEVRAYCKERNNAVDAQRFLDYYTANGWKVGKNPMKDWKAAVRTWERGEKKDKKHGFEERTYDYADLEERLVNK